MALLRSEQWHRVRLILPLASIDFDLVFVFTLAVLLLRWFDLLCFFSDSLVFVFWAGLDLLFLFLFLLSGWILTVIVVRHFLHFVIYLIWSVVLLWLRRLSLFPLILLNREWLIALVIVPLPSFALLLFDWLRVACNRLFFIVRLDHWALSPLDHRNGYFAVPLLLSRLFVQGVILLLSLLNQLIFKSASGFRLWMFDSWESLIALKLFKLVLVLSRCHTVWLAPRRHAAHLHKKQIVRNTTTRETLREVCWRLCMLPTFWHIWLNILNKVFLQENYTI